MLKPISRVWLRSFGPIDDVWEDAQTVRSKATGIAVPSQDWILVPMAFANTDFPFASRRFINAARVKFASVGAALAVAVFSCVGPQHTTANPPATGVARGEPPSPNSFCKVHPLFLIYAAHYHLRSLPREIQQV